MQSSKFFTYSLTVSFLLVALFIFSNQSVFAQTDQNVQRIEQTGIVPCGHTPADTCKPCDVFKLAKNLTDYIVGVAFFIATAAIGVGGFMILVGAYSEERVKIGKQILTDAVIGLLIILFAWFAVDTAIKLLLGANLASTQSSSITPPYKGVDLGPWNSFNCEALQLPQ